MSNRSFLSFQVCTLSNHKEPFEVGTVLCYSRSSQSTKTIGGQLQGGRLLLYGVVEIKHSIDTGNVYIDMCKDLPFTKNIEGNEDM